MTILTNKNLNDYADWREKVETEGGAALVFKEKEWTSFDVVAKLRGMVRTKKVGHAGTLDPLAEGLLILCFGKATKSINEFQDAVKKYTGVVKLGATTVTDDSEAEEENISDFSSITDDQIKDAVSSFIGKIKQTPPKYSAKKIAGRKMYEMARKNIEFEVKEHEVEIFEINVLDVNLPFVTIDVICSKGTYIRSLARDIGTKLNCGAYLSGLLRTKIGEYSSDDAFKISELAEIVSKINQIA